MKKLKVALVSPFPPSEGTLNEYAFHLVRHFRSKEEIAELSIITDKLPSGKKYRIEGDGVPVKFFPVWKFNAIKTPWVIIKTLMREKPDVVLFNIHFLSFGDNKIVAALGLLLPFLCRILGLPSVVLLHNIVETVDLKSAGMTQIPLLSKMYQMIGTILTQFILWSNMVAVTISKYVQILEKKYGADNVTLIPHGSFETPEQPEFSIPEGPKQVMAFGKFGTYKKVEAMIEAIEIIRARTTEDIEIVIAGTDSPNRKGYLQDIKQKYSHVPQMRFTGYVAEEDVPKVFSESAVVVFPYTSTTGSSGVLHQAGMYGRACVLPKLGDLKELIEEEGYTGLYFDPEDAASLANAIQNILQDNTLREKIGKQNYVAAASLPMSAITDWYLLHFRNIIVSNSNLPTGLRKIIDLKWLKMKSNIAVLFPSFFKNTLDNGKLKGA